MREQEQLLKVLANRRRLGIIKHLKDRREASVGVIADAIKLSLKATSKHLAILYATGLVEREQRSLLMYYRLVVVPPHLIRSVITNL